MALFRKAEQFIQLCQGGDDGLFAENVLSGQQRSLGLLKMQAVGVAIYISSTSGSASISLYSV